MNARSLPSLAASVYVARRFLLIAACLLCAAPPVFATLANAWHIPDNSADLGGTHMRDPWMEISNNPASPTTVTVYSGVQKYGNAYGTANQTGGTLYFKGASQNVWQTAALGFVSDNGNNQFWKASFSTAGIAANDPIQYYLLLTFNAGAENTYIYAPAGAGDKGGATTNSQATAASSPYTVRNRPGWVFHADNRVVSGGSVQFWAKVGYAGDVNTASSKWADNGALYYTTDGTTPQPGATPGTAGNASTQVVNFVYDHPDAQNNGTGSIAGTPMWWVANASGLPTFTAIKYKVGFWNASNLEQKFGDYNAGDGGSSAGHTFSFSIGTIGDPSLTVNGVGANYTTTHMFVDEAAGTSQPLTILFSPNQPNVVAAEVFTNLNRRDKATTAYTDANGIATEEGIEPYDGNAIALGDDTHYYKAYSMTPTSNPGEYSIALSGSKTGAYRLTARWKVQGDNTWRWFTNLGANRRDHAIVVSPVDARKINLYEVNVLNMDANGDDFAHRGTLEDLYDAPNAPHTGANNHWNLDYVKNLGCNWLWFQPIHPIGQEGQSFTPGSPYAVRNFFEINPIFSTSYSGSDTNINNLTSAANRSAAMGAFQGLVSAANNKGVGIMLDAPFNHSAPDLELAAKGVQLFSPGAQPGNLVRDREARFFSRTDNYAMRASGASNIAVAPDRYDFGKWGDVRDIFFGRYAALVDVQANQGNYNNEGDWFDYTIGNEGLSGSGNGHFDAVTQGVWKYFAEYTLFWLAQTGVPQGSDLATQTSKGIGGLRADFGQGLPPQIWEYIINKTRARKWNFVFMAESLDGGAVTYRSNRHFDILNENIVFPLKSASTTTDYRNIFESRRSAYGQSLVLLNNMSHDEEAYGDPFIALTRYAVCSTVDGVPLIFPGEELGISTVFGYHQYEVNFGKNIAHFKRYNDMLDAWNKVTAGSGSYDYGFAQLHSVYSGIGQARLFSRALRSPNRWFLDQTGNGGAHAKIFSVAKYETANASPNTADVVFAFANIDRDSSPAGNFNLNITQNGSNLFGIKRGRTYGLKNIAAYIGAYTPPNAASRRDVFVNTQSGDLLLDNGLYVGLNKVPTTNAEWGTASSEGHPYEAQYLKLYDITPPPAAGAPDAGKAYAIGNAATFSWSAASDPDGGVSGYHVVISTAANGGGTVLFDGNVSGTSKTVTGAFDQTLYAKVTTVNNAGVESASASNSVKGTILLNPAGDKDGDGITNADEDAAGTNPLDNADFFRVTAVTPAGAGSVQVTWKSVPGKNYKVQWTSDLSAGFAGAPDESAVIPAASGTTTSFLDTAAGGARKFYRVKLVP